MAKKIRKTMTDAQLAAAVEELNSQPNIPKLRGSKVSFAHRDERRYSRKTRREGKRISNFTY